MRRKLRYLQSAAGHHAADFIAIRLALRCPPQIKQPRIPAGNLHALIAELRRPSANALQSMERRPIPRKLRQKNPRSLDRPHCSPQFHLVAMMISGETLLYSFSFLKRICSGLLLASPVSSRGYGASALFWRPSNTVPFWSCPFMRSTVTLLRLSDHHHAAT